MFKFARNKYYLVVQCPICCPFLAATRKLAYLAKDTSDQWGKKNARCMKPGRLQVCNLFYYFASESAPFYMTTGWGHKLAKGSWYVWNGAPCGAADVAPWSISAHANQLS